MVYPRPKVGKMPADIEQLIYAIFDGIQALAAMATNSNSDSNSLGGTNYLLDSEFTL